VYQRVSVTAVLGVPAVSTGQPSRTPIACVVLALLVPPVGAGSSESSIGVLFIGDAFLQGAFPAVALAEDPWIRLMPVIADTWFITSIDVKRYLRIYLPRTEEALVEGYRLVIICAARSEDFPRSFEEWIEQGVAESGLGFLMADDPTCSAVLTISTVSRHVDGWKRR